MKHQAYFTRALKANDRRYARVFEKLGYRTTDLVSSNESPMDIQGLRELYEKIAGKKPFMGWDADTLSEKIAEKRAAA